MVIGVASYGALGHVPPLDFQLYFFSGNFRAAQTLTLDSMWFPTQKEDTGLIWPHSFDSVYCMNFTIFLCVVLKFFSLLVSCPSSHQILATPMRGTINFCWLADRRTDADDQQRRRLVYSWSPGSAGLFHEETGTSARRAWIVLGLWRRASGAVTP